MSHSYVSVLELVTDKPMLDSHVRRVAAACVRRYFEELIKKHGIADISEDDIEELAYDLIDELSVEEFSSNMNN